MDFIGPSSVPVVLRFLESDGWRRFDRVEPDRRKVLHVIAALGGWDSARLLRDESDRVATKDHIARLEARFDRLEDRIDQVQRTFVMAIVGSMTAPTAIFSLVVGLIT